MKEVRLTGPKNSVSQLYGNGYNSCGSLSYQILDSNARKTANSPIFSLESKTDMRRGDELVFKVTSAAGNGPVITEKFIILIYLNLISKAQPKLLPISVSYRECEVIEYVPPKIDNQEFSYQRFDPVVIFFAFEQSSCTFDQTYEAHITVASTGQKSPLPSFIQLDAT